MRSGGAAGRELVSDPVAQGSACARLELRAAETGIRDSRIMSKAELAVRAEANELESLAVELAINEYKIRPKRAVAKVFPLAGERMIAKS
jgi:hypothetical protein